MRDVVFSCLKVGTLIYIAILAVWLTFFKPFLYNAETYFHVPYIDFFVPFGAGFAFLTFWSLGHFVMLIEDSDNSKHNLTVALLSAFGALICLVVFFGAILFSLR